jgi:nicotinate-nucleotide pyrophosphorylase (carboxylating)
MKTYLFLRGSVIEQHPMVERIVRFAIEEDLGTGDLTTDAIIAPTAQGKASLIAREELVLAGLPVFKKVFLEIGSEIEFEEYFSDGDLIPAKKSVCFMRGPLSLILRGERTGLNFLQRMSGIATLTKQYVEKAGSSKIRILDTRKTTPGLRLLEKYAVNIGGGFSHRFGLFDGILIKDNHIAAAGSITSAIELARKGAPHTLRIEVEVEDLAGVEEALQARADTILLDNMPVREIRDAVRLVDGRTMLEASGGITLDTIEEVANTGVDFVSVGALTHSVRSADFSLEIIPET